MGLAGLSSIGLWLCHAEGLRCICDRPQCENTTCVGKKCFVSRSLENGHVVRSKGCISSNFQEQCQTAAMEQYAMECCSSNMCNENMDVQLKGTAVQLVCSSSRTPRGCFPSSRLWSVTSPGLLCSPSRRAGGERASTLPLPLAPSQGIICLPEVPREDTSLKNLLLMIFVPLSALLVLGVLLALFSWKMVQHCQKRQQFTHNNLGDLDLVLKGSTVGDSTLEVSGLYTPLPGMDADVDGPLGSGKRVSEPQCPSPLWTSAPRCTSLTCIGVIPHATAPQAPPAWTVRPCLPPNRPRAMLPAASCRGPLATALTGFPCPVPPGPAE